MYNAYLDRLKVIHSTVSETFSDFSTFITEYYEPEEYEEIMVGANPIYAKTAERLSARESIETRIATAKRDGDTFSEWTAFSEYIELEKEVSNTRVRAKHERKKAQQEREGFFDRVCALFDRMVLRWGSEARVWTEYILFVVSCQGPHTCRKLTIISLRTRRMIHSTLPRWEEQALVVPGRASYGRSSTTPWTRRSSP